MRAFKHYTQEYIHSASVGDLAECTIMLNYIGDKMTNYFSSGLIGGHQAYIIRNECDYRNNFLEADVSRFTNGRYPYVYIFIQPINEEPLNIGEIMHNLGYTRIV